MRLPQLTKTQKKVAWGVGIAAAVALVGYGAVKVFSSEKIPEGVTKEQDSEIRYTVAFVVANENDPAVLTDLAAKLLAVGYDDLAKQVSERATQLRASLPPSSQSSSTYVQR